MSAALQLPLLRMISSGRSALAREDTTADLILPGENGMPAADKAKETQPAIIAREAGRTGPLEVINKDSKFKDPH